MRVSWVEWICGVVRVRGCGNKFLKVEERADVREAVAAAAAWKESYKRERPHSSPG